MTVAELIEHLQKQPQHLQVAFMLHSEYMLMQPDDIQIMDQCEPRPDGWIHYRRPDKPTQTYLMFPGN